MDEEELEPAMAEPESWPEYELAYSIFDNAPDDTPKGELRDRISAAIRTRRGED